MHILIEKSKRMLTLIREDAIPLSFPIVLGKCPEGHKLREGDFRTPEGEYYICTRNENSKYHLALGLSYPNPSDADAALEWIHAEKSPFLSMNPFFPRIPTESVRRGTLRSAVSS